MTVSILMITYNHENFIREAIEGVLMQKTDFPIELIIGEDCSTDNTRELVMEYSYKYPEIIRPLLPENNLGMMKNFIVTMQAATGKYIALCEGDDYWTDPLKLQKQVDFLEANPEFSLCSHRYRFYYEDSNIFQDDLNADLFVDCDNYFYDEEIIFGRWITQPLTVVFRKENCDLEFLNKLGVIIDFTFFYTILRYGKGCLMNFIGGVYRKHSGGITAINSRPERNMVSYLITKSLYYAVGDKFLKSTHLENIPLYLKNYIKYSKKIDFTYAYSLYKEGVMIDGSFSWKRKIYYLILKAFILRYMIKLRLFY